MKMEEVCDSEPFMAIWVRSVVTEMVAWNAFRVASADIIIGLISLRVSFLYGPNMKQR